MICSGLHKIIIQFDSTQYLLYEFRTYDILPTWIFTQSQQMSVLFFREVIEEQW